MRYKNKKICNKHKNKKYIKVNTVRNLLTIIKLFSWIKMWGKLVLWKFLVKSDQKPQIIQNMSETQEKKNSNSSCLNLTFYVKDWTYATFYTDFQILVWCRKSAKEKCFFFELFFSPLNCVWIKSIVCTQISTPEYTV